MAPSSAWPHPHPGEEVGEPHHHSGMTADQIAQELANPISSVWSLQLQNNMTFLRGSPSHVYRGEFTSNLQPAMPFHLTDDWNLIMRPVFNFTSTPTVDSTGSFDRANGIGETSLISLLSPQKVKGGLLWGAGPTFIFPTTTRDDLSQRKYAAGPSAVFLKMSKKWVYGIFPQYWWSFSGSDKQGELSQGNLQYFLWRSMGNGWQVGMAPNITYDRKAKGSNAWTVPVGLGVQKVVKLGELPIKFTLEAQAMVIHPDDFGPRWNLRFAITPVIPALIKGNLF
jgi:hypothetical protein